MRLELCDDDSIWRNLNDKNYNVLCAIYSRSLHVMERQYRAKRKARNDFIAKYRDYVNFQKPRKRFSRNIPVS